MPYGIPKTDAERSQQHRLLYGTDELPPRGTGLRRTGTFAGFEQPPIGAAHVAIAVVVGIVGAVVGYVLAKST